MFYFIPNRTGIKMEVQYLNYFIHRQNNVFFYLKLVNAPGTFVFASRYDGMHKIKRDYEEWQFFACPVLITTICRKF